MGLTPSSNTYKEKEKSDSENSNINNRKDRSHFSIGNRARTKKVGIFETEKRDPPRDLKDMLWPWLTSVTHWAHGRLEVWG